MYIFIYFHVKYEHRNKHNFLNVLKLLSLFIKKETGSAFYACFTKKFALDSYSAQAQ